MASGEILGARTGEGVGSRRSVADRPSMDAPRGEERPATPLVGRARLVDDARLREVLAAAPSPLGYWEDPDGDTIVAAGAAAVVQGTTAPEIATVAEDVWRRIAFDGPATARPRMIGAMSFDGSTPIGPAWSGFPATYFFLPQRLVVRDGDTVYETVLAPEAEDVPPLAVGSPPSSRPLRIAGRTPVPTEKRWTTAATRLRDRIRDGAFHKVVLAHSMRIELERPPSPLECVDRLRTANPGAQLTLLRPDPAAIFVAATPERLVERQGATVTTEALAGSIQRGDTAADDERLSTALATDEKERHEHRLVVDAIREDLDAMGGAVTVGDLEVRRLRSVQHLATPVQAIHPDEPHVLDLVAALHPTPAVGGMPREAAMAAIRAEESFDRGWYAAPIGWFDAAGDGAFAVGIRSAVLREGTGRLFAGSGLVRESDPEAEWAELQWKYRPILESFDAT